MKKTKNQKKLNLTAMLFFSKIYTIINKIIFYEYS